MATLMRNAYHVMTFGWYMLASNVLPERGGEASTLSDVMWDIKRESCASHRSFDVL